MGNVVRAKKKSSSLVWSNQQVVGDAKLAKPACVENTARIVALTTHATTSTATTATTHGNYACQTVKIEVSDEYYYSYSYYNMTTETTINYYHYNYPYYFSFYSSYSHSYSYPY